MAWYDFLFGKIETQDIDEDGIPDFVRTQVPYEVLIRFSEDGEAQGAHVIYRDNAYYRGELLKTEIGLAKDLPLETLPMDDILASISING
jgi:hypothetical protein